MQLKINGRNCHSTGDYGRIDRTYLQERLMQMQHSNSTTDYWRAVDKHVDVSENESSHDLGCKCSPARSTGRTFSPSQSRCIRRTTQPVRRDQH